MKAVLTLKSAALDWGEEGSPANNESLCKAAETYYKAFMEYKSDRGD